jgi:hypothetical protein
MEEKHHNYKVEVALKATFFFSTKKPINSKQLVKKFRKQQFSQMDTIVEPEGAEFLYVISTEPLENNNDEDGPN